SSHELQWDHLTLEVVIRSCVHIGLLHVRASIGPPLFRGGHVGLMAKSGGRVIASMGPPLFRGGHGLWERPIDANGQELQWGHLSLEVVMQLLLISGTENSGFNGATSL